VDERVDERSAPKAGRTDPAALDRLLNEWMQGDEAEQRDTFETLRQALDKDRPPAYKLFP
jgi:hypothetical protein